MRVINKAINARYEAASQIHEEIQTPAVLALLVLAKALSVLEGGCMWCVRLQDPFSRRSSKLGIWHPPVGPKPLHELWWDLKIKLEKANWSRRTVSSSQLPGLDNAGPELSEHLSRPAALSAWSSWKKEWDDVSAAEPTSNTLSLAAVRAWGRAQARSWMEMPLNVDLNWIYIYFCAGGELREREKTPKTAAGSNCKDSFIFIHIYIFINKWKGLSVFVFNESQILWIR